MDRRLEVLKDIIRDVELDARYYDEQPFTGRAVAEYMGKQGAMILALAHILETLIPTDEGF